MSVHGEYGRALRHVLERLDEQDAERARSHREAFDAAQTTPARDLSSAARAALVALARLEADPAFAASSTPDDSQDTTPHNPLIAASVAAFGKIGRRLSDEALRDACHHLRAHCRAILGAAAPEL